MRREVGPFAWTHVLMYKSNNFTMYQVRSPLKKSLDQDAKEKLLHIYWVPDRTR